MDILLRSARIINTGSPLHNQVKDILISDGIIKKIGNKIPKPSRAKEIKIDNLHISIGWFDLNTYLADPGYEQKETIVSGCRAAAAGGFTHICCMPDTDPVIQTKSQVEYVLKKSADETVTVHPVGVISHNTEGNDLAEMYDMHETGAVAFSDGPKANTGAGIMERALLYVKAFDGLILSHPEEKSISANGAMHEGRTSIHLGLPAAPALAEEIAVNRDIYLLEYTASKLHFLDVSLKNSVDLIRRAKKKGLRITASVNAYNLVLKDSDLIEYDTNLKLNPHLRSKDDVAGLIKGIEDGTLDTITSAHRPHDEECKKLEFDKADFGMIGLETCFALASTALKGKVPLGRLIEIFAINPRRVLGLEIPKIEEGAGADLTLFDPSAKWVFKEENIKSKSKNTPFIGTGFTGKPLGVINKGKIQLN